MVSAYSKSLFQSVHANSLEARKEKKNFKKFLFSPTVNLGVQDGIVTPGIVYEELLLVKGLFLVTNEQQKIFQNPTFSEKTKVKMIFDLFPGFSPVMQSFLKLLVERNHLSFLPQIFEEFEKIFLKSEKILELKILLANSFPEKFRKRFFHLLKKRTKAKEVLFSIVYDPSILGGILIEYNSMVIDGSFSRELGTLFFE